MCEGTAAGAAQDTTLRPGEASEWQQESWQPQAGESAEDEQPVHAVQIWFGNDGASTCEAKREMSLAPGPDGCDSSSVNGGMQVMHQPGMDQTNPNVCMDQSNPSVCHYIIVEQGGFAYGGDGQQGDLLEGYGDQATTGSTWPYFSSDWGSFYEVGDSSFDGSCGWLSGTTSEAGGWDVADDASAANWSYDQGSEAGTSTRSRDGDWPRHGRSLLARGAGLRHIQVPRRLNLQAWSSCEEKAAEVTTLMVRNVPNRYDRGLLMQELDELGFRDKYDFVYLPIDNSTNWNVGYAFVNFEDPADAKHCIAKLDGHQFYRFRQNNRRVAQVSIAHIQGLEKNLAHCSSTSLFSARPWLRPWVRKWSSRPRDAQKPGSRLRSAIPHRQRNWSDGGLDGEESDDDISLENLTLAPRLLETQSVELMIGEASSPSISMESLQELLACGARRLRLLPDMISADVGGCAPWSAPAVRSTLLAVKDLPDADHLEIEILPTGCKKPLVLSKAQLKEENDVEEKTAVVVEGRVEEEDLSPELTLHVSARSTPAPVQERGWSGSGNGGWSEARWSYGGGRSWRRGGYWRHESKPSRQRCDSWKTTESLPKASEAADSAGGFAPDGATDPGAAGDQSWSECAWGQEQHGQHGQHGGTGFQVQNEQAFGNHYDSWQNHGTGEDFAPSMGGGGAAVWQMQEGVWPQNMMIFSEGDIRLCYMAPHESNGLSGVEASGDAIADVPTKNLDGVNGQMPEGCKEESVTTLMIHNIPCHYSHEGFLKELESLDLHSVCDFAHVPQLPTPDGTTWNIGHAFVNFVTPADAERARGLLQGHKWQDCAPGCEQVAEVSDAVVQGYQANVQHYHMATVGELGSWDTTWCVLPSMPCQNACEPSLVSSTPTSVPLGNGDDNMTPSQCSWDDQVPGHVSRTPSPSPDRRHPAAAAVQWSHNIVAQAVQRARSRSPAATRRSSDCSVAITVASGASSEAAEASCQPASQPLQVAEQEATEDRPSVSTEAQSLPQEPPQDCRKEEATPAPKSAAAAPARCPAPAPEAHRRSAGGHAARGRGGQNSAAQPRGRVAARTKRAKSPEGPPLGIAEWPALGAGPADTTAAPRPGPKVIKAGGR